MTTLIAAVGLILLVVGVARTRIWWLALGAVLLAIAVLQTALNQDEPWQSIEIVTLRIRVADAAGQPVRPSLVRIGRPGGGRSSISTLGPNGVVIVSAVVEARGKGSVGQQLRRIVSQGDLDDFRLEVVAEGYRRWQTPLALLLPRDWPLTTPKETIEVRLEPAR